MAWPEFALRTAAALLALFVLFLLVDEQAERYRTRQKRRRRRAVALRITFGVPRGASRNELILFLITKRGRADGQKEEGRRMQRILVGGSIPDFAQGIDVDGADTDELEQSGATYAWNTQKPEVGVVEEPTKRSTVLDGVGTGESALSVTATRPDGSALSVSESFGVDPVVPVKPATGVRIQFGDPVPPLTAPAALKSAKK